MKNGAEYRIDGACSFSVWAPLLRRLDLRLTLPQENVFAMEKDGHGYWRLSIQGNISPETRYYFRINDTIERPDPASFYQPEGVHGPSQVIDHGAFPWDDNKWRGISLFGMIIYELHVGTFTPEGTLDAIVPRLEALTTLGVNTIELMPVSQFPGERNWGYDGVFPYAVQNSYGGPISLKKLVNECHKKGIAVVLDVVYNHLGPEGNYLRDFGPYFTDRYGTPWGEAMNFDGPYSGGVRAFFIENALHWLRHYHIDALRIDAIHAITDMSAEPFLRELARKVGEFSSEAGRKYYLIAESDLNDARVIAPMELGGCGLDAQWNDDFHHALHALITGEDKGYYQDFGKVTDLGKALSEGFVYSGQYSRFRKRKHGNDSKDRPAHQFIVFSQSHDQVGNRMAGDRLSKTQSFEKLKLAAGVVLLSPNIPLLFMGEEYGEIAPFNYFTSHSDSSLVQIINRSRKEEFASLGWSGEPPDTQAESTFLNSKLVFELHSQGRHKVLFDFYKELIRLRKKIFTFQNLSKEATEVRCFEEEKALFLRREWGYDEVFVLYNFRGINTNVDVVLRNGRWNKLLESSSEEWGGAGGLAKNAIESRGSETKISILPHSFVFYRIVNKER